MAEGEFFTFNVWQLRQGHQGRELEDLTIAGIIPLYSQIEGCKEVRLFRIEEGDDVGKYLAITVYENRDVYNKWFTSNSREFQIWQNNLATIMERWQPVADRTSNYRATQLVDHSYKPKGLDDLPPLPPTTPTRPPIVF